MPAMAVHSGENSQNEEKPRPAEFTPRLKLQGAGQGALAHLILANTLFRNGRHGQALAELNAALGENPELAEAHFLKGILLALRAEFAGALEALEYATRLKPEQADYWQALATVELEL